MAKSKRGKNAKEDTEEKKALAQKVDIIAAKLDAATLQIDRLHRQWRYYLFGLSCMVFVVSLYQLHQQATQCSQHLTLIGSDSHVFDLLESVETRKWVLLDLGALALGCLMALFLSLYLSPNSAVSSWSVSFFHPLFLAAQLTMVPVATLYYLGLQRSKERGIASCLHDDQQLQVLLLAVDPVPAKQKHPIFPVSVVFLCISMVSLGFMKYQRSKHNYHVNAMKKAKEQMQSSKNKKRQ